MLKIKLVKTGKKNSPTFRISVGEGKRVVEYLGVYNPQHTPPLLEVSKEKIQEWVKKGAHLTPAVDQILKGKYTYRKYVPKSAEGTSETAPAAQNAPVAEAKAPAVQEETKSEEKTEEKAPEVPPQV